MSKLKDLINKLCSNGVEYKSLDSIVSISTGKLNANAMVEDGEYAFFTCDANPFRIDKYAFDGEAILISGNGSQVGHLNYYIGKFNAYQRTYVLMNFVDDIVPKYLYHYLNTYLKGHIDENSKKGSVPYITLPMLQGFNVPIPPLEVQEEIVKILDKFGELEVELEAELEARKSQYEFWHRKLFDFDENVNEFSLEELCNIVDYRGKTPKKVDSGIFLVTAKNIKMGYIDYEYSKEYIAESDFDDVMRRGKANIGDVLFTTEAPCGHVAQVDKNNIALAQRVIKYSSKDFSRLNNKYLKYALLSNQFQNKLLGTSTGATVKGIKGSKLHKMTIPVPTIEKQNQIVNILERFEILINDISEGLPAEIELRKQQYEYYRNKLLSFEEYVNE